ncbi:hypothetical protein JTB14_034310 [Gonioctena quinquepunctata]|nr:hypothetical protein JTB14_034310 [Gonioctena quinquepunctata]
MVILSTEMLRHQSFKRINIFLSWILFKEGSIGTMLILFLTMIAKVLVGEHRPNFFEVCEPDTARNCTEGSFVETYVCISSKYGLHKIANSSLSFPSGHASTVWFIGTFSSIIYSDRKELSQSDVDASSRYIEVEGFLETWFLVCENNQGGDS